MKRTGAHHIGLATYDYEGIVDFYTRVLGWEIAWQDLMTGPDGTVFMKHVFFDTGDGSYVSFMCPTADMPDHPKKWDRHQFRSWRHERRLPFRLLDRVGRRAGK